MQNKIHVRPLSQPLWLIFRVLGQPNTMQTIFYILPLFISAFTSWLTGAFDYEFRLKYHNSLFGSISVCGLLLGSSPHPHPLEARQLNSTAQRFFHSHTSPSPMCVFLFVSFINLGGYSNVQLVHAISCSNI